MYDYYLLGLSILNISRAVCCSDNLAALMRRILANRWEFSTVASANTAGCTRIKKHTHIHTPARGVEETSKGIDKRGDLYTHTGCA